VSAISDMVAPVVLITVGTIFANGLLTAGTTLADRKSALSQEHMGILRGPHGEPGADETALAALLKIRAARPTARCNAG